MIAARYNHDLKKNNVETLRYWMDKYFGKKGHKDSFDIRLVKICEPNEYWMYLYKNGYVEDSDQTTAEFFDSLLYNSDFRQSHTGRIDAFTRPEYRLDFDKVSTPKPEKAKVKKIKVVIPPEKKEAAGLVDLWNDEPQAASEPQTIIDAISRTIFVKAHQRLRKGKMETVKAHSRTVTKKEVIDLKKLELRLEKARLALEKARLRLEKAQTRNISHKNYQSWLDLAQANFDQKKEKEMTVFNAVSKWI